MQRRGGYPPPPGASDLLGLEVSGIVIACAADVSTFQIGDQVCALTNGGGYAEFVAVDARHCLPLPENVGLVDAAGLPESYFTVWSNLFMDAAPAPDARALIHGGAGGIGSTAIQLAKALGMHVFTTVGSEENAAFCTDLGADQTINYHHEDFVEIVRDAGQADLILDSIGGDYIARNIKAAAPGGKIVQIGFSAGAKVEINLMPVMLKRICLTGSTLRSRPAAFKAEIATQLTERVWPLFAKGACRPVTYQSFPLGDAAAAHRINPRPICRKGRKLTFRARIRIYGLVRSGAVSEVPRKGQRGIRPVARHPSTGDRGGLRNSTARISHTERYSSLHVIRHAWP